MPSVLAQLGTIYMSLGSDVDVSVGIYRIQGTNGRGRPDADGLINAKLNNENFVRKAKPEVVEQQQVRRAGADREKAKVAASG